MCIKVKSCHLLRTLKFNNIYVRFTTMFSATSLTSFGARCGKLDKLGVVENIEIPTCMLYTRTGSVPYLTKDMLLRIEQLPRLVQMPLPLLIEHVDTLEKFGKGLKEFTAMQDFAVVCTLHDPVAETRSGYNDSKSIGVWGRSGKVMVDEEKWLKIAQCFRPDMLQVLSDSDTPEGCSIKRRVKAAERSKQMLKRYHELYAKSEGLAGVNILTTLQGARDYNERIKYAKEVIEIPSTGFILEGFHNYGEATEHIKVANWKNIIKAVVKLLPDSSIRILPGIMTPHNVLDAVEFGVDIFDSSYAYIVTERGSALVFKYKTDSLSDENMDNRGTEIDLRDKKYSEDLSPVVEGCRCYTCQKHTKAYIWHLLNTKEILGSILLMVHNLHHYIRFFEELRQSLKDNNYDSFARLVRSQTTCTKTAKS